MSKKIISLALVLIMALGMFSVPAMAAGVTLSLDQTDYKAGALITITFSGVTDGQIAAQAVVAYAKQGASASEYEKWTYVKQGSGTVTLWASNDTGNYEMRFYQARSINETNLVSSATVKFTVGGGSATTPPTTQPPTIQPPTTQPPAQTTDEPSSWAVEQVNKAIAEKLVPQSLQSKYTQTITRAEFCALAVLLYENIKGTITGRTTFTDTKDVNVEKMASIGVVSGVGNNKFDPDAKLTREQAAVMLSRLAEAVGKPFEKKAATFADNGKVSSWALEGVGQVQAAGIMGGVGNNTFAPQDPYTREQSIITILRTYDAVKSGGTPDPTKPTDPPVSGDQSIIGAWSAVPTLQIGHVKEWVEFKSDGTFTHYNSVFRNDPTYMDYQLTTTGKYTVSNGKIYCTNVKETYKVNTGAGQSYENKSVSDCVWLYKFEVKPWDTSEMNWLGEIISEGSIDVLWLQINFSPDSNDDLLNVYTGFAKPFEETVNSGIKTDPTKPTDPPSATEKELVGFWADNPEDTIDKVLSNGRWIEFKSDGTFSLRYNVYWYMNKTQKMLATKVFLKGNYKVENNKIVTSNVLQSAEESLDGYGGTYSDRSITLPAWDYKFSDSHPNGGSWPGYNWITVNLLDWDDEAEWYSYVKRDDYK